MPQFLRYNNSINPATASTTWQHTSTFTIWTSVWQSILARCFHFIPFFMQFYLLWIFRKNWLKRLSRFQITMNLPSSFPLKMPNQTMSTHIRHDRNIYTPTHSQARHFLLCFDQFQQRLLSICLHKNWLWQFAIFNFVLFDFADGTLIMRKSKFQLIHPGWLKRITIPLTVCCFHYGFHQFFCCLSAKMQFMQCTLISALNRHHIAMK